MLASIMDSISARGSRQHRRSLRAFDRFAKRAKPKLSAHYGAEFADGVLAEARVELDALIPELPYIGGLRNVFTPVVVVNGWGIALHRAMKARGKVAADTVRICAEVSDEVVASVPGVLLKMFGSLAFSPFSRRYFKKQAARSQERRYEEDFVYEVEEGEDGELAMVFSECAVNKLYEAQDVEDLKPYCNFFDVTYSRLMDMGCDATETIGLGCGTCALRYKRGRATEIPPTLKGVLPRT
jgi:hypothetical protein